MKDYAVTAVQIDDMKHCIGLKHDNVTGTKHRKYSVYRNYFTTAGDDPDWDNLVGQGLATKHDFPRGCGDNPKAYCVSKEGLELLNRIMDINITEAD